MARRKIEVFVVGDASNLKRALGKSAKDVDKYGRDVDRLAKRQQRSMERVKKSAAVMGTALAGGLAFGMAKAGKDTIAFDKAMRNVNSIAQLNEKQFGRLQKQVLGLAGKTAQAPQTLAEGLYDLVSSGFKGRDALNVLQASAKAATAGLTTTEVSSKAVAAVLNAYKRPAKDAAKVSDTLFRTVDRGVISFESLSENIGDVLPFAASLGIGLDQVGASIATMTKAGISGPETMTRIKAAMQSFLKPSAAMSKALKSQGYESGEALIKAKGFQGALEVLAKTTGGSKEKMAALFPNIRALGGALALTGGNAKGAGKDLRDLKDSSGATEKALSQQSKSISLQWQKAKASMQAVGIAIGNEVVPHVAKGARAVAGFVTEIQNGTGAGGRFADKVRTIAGVVGSAAGAIKGFVSSTGGLAAIGAVVGGLTGRFVALGAAMLVGKVAAFAGALSKAGGAMAFLNAAVKANPLGVALTVMGAVAGALGILKLKSDDAKVSTQQLSDAFRNQADAMRAVRDIDIDVAQRKANVKSANVAVAQAEKNLADARKRYGRNSLQARQAEADLRQARVQQKRATRDLGDVEEDSKRKRQDARKATERSRETAEKYNAGIHKTVKAKKREIGELDRSI